MVARRGDLAVSTRKMTEEADQVGAGPESGKDRKRTQKVQSQARSFHLKYKEFFFVFVIIPYSPVITITVTPNVTLTVTHDVTITVIV